MAKNSMVARENKRTRTVRRLAAKRAELKAVIKSTTASYEERVLAEVPTGGVSACGSECCRSTRSCDPQADGRRPRSHRHKPAGARLS